MPQLSTIIDWTLGTTSRRRASVEHHPVLSQVAEVLEIRAVPAPLALGLYADNSVQGPDIGDRVNVLTNTDKKQHGKFLFATTSQVEVTNFDVQIISKNSGVVKIKSLDENVHGKATLNKQAAEFESSFKYKSKLNGEVLTNSGTMFGPQG